MNRTKQRLTASLLATASLSLLAAPGARAVTFTEPGDAGQTLATAAYTAGTVAAAGQPLTAITGTFNSATDADLFVLQVASPTTFSATTINAATGTTNQDTALFLFNAVGTPVGTNDDANGSTVQSTLPAGAFTLAAGTYYLGISLSGNEPVNSNGQLLFAGYPNGDTTAVRGPAAGLNPATLGNFNGQTSFAQSGAYEIDLTGAATAVPEPSAWAALLLGTVGTAFAVLRRRAPRAA